jgi:predicted small lipoprotein YifL
MSTARCVLALLLFASLAGCQPKQTGEIPPAASSSSSSSTSEADRTRELERKAADLDKRTEALKTMTGSEQEKIDAANQIDKERRELADQQTGH